MRRRTTLQASAALGITVVGGCLNVGEFLNDDDEEEPIEADPETLLLSMDHLDETLEWSEENPQPEFYEPPTVVSDADATTSYYPHPPDDGPFESAVGFVTTAVWVYDDADEAIEGYENLPFYEGWGFQERDIGTESIVGHPEFDETHVFFRDVNTVGGLVYTSFEQSEDEREPIATALAEEKQRDWRDE